MSADTDTRLAIMTAIAKDLRRGITKGTVASIHKAQLEFKNGIHIVGVPYQDRIWSTGPAVLMRLQNCWRFDAAYSSEDIRICILLFVTAGELRVIHCYHKGRQWCSAHDWLGRVPLADPALLDKLATVLTRVGIKYTPSKEARQ